MINKEVSLNIIPEQLGNSYVCSPILVSMITVQSLVNIWSYSFDTSRLSHNSSHAIDLHNSKVYSWWKETLMYNLRRKII